MSMPSATSQPSDEVEDEFSDGGVDWGKVGTIADTAQEMQAAAEREEKIAGLILEAQAAVKKIKEGRKGGGSGRPPARGPLGSDAFEAAKSRLARLQRGLLPCENEHTDRRTQPQLLAAAQLHPQDHPGAGNSTRHDHAQLRAEMYGNLPARGGGADEGADHDDPDGGDGGGGGGGGGGSGDGDGGVGAWDSSDDDDPQPRLKEATVSEAQQDFIVKCTGKVTSHTADNYKFMPPCASIGPRASAALFMLEMVVVWLPHIIWRKLGIPPQPPCPVHGFPDEGEDDFVMSKGMARGLPRAPAAAA